MLRVVSLGWTSDQMQPAAVFYGARLVASLGYQSAPCVVTKVLFVSSLPTNPRQREIRLFCYNVCDAIATVCSSRGGHFSTRFISAFLARRLFA